MDLLRCNDLHNLENELGNNILVKYLQDLNFSQNLRSKQNLIDNALRKKIGIEEKKVNLNYPISLNFII